MVWPFDFKLLTWQVPRTSCWVPLCVFLHITYGLLKLTFSSGMLSCHCDLLRHFNSVHSSLTCVFHLADFVDISYLTYFERTTLQRVSHNFWRTGSEVCSEIPNLATNLAIWSHSFQSCYELRHEVGNYVANFARILRTYLIQSYGRFRKLDGPV